MRARIAPATLYLTALVGSWLATSLLAHSREPLHPAPAGNALQAPASAGAATLPRVRLIATGGTISNRSGGRLTAEELVSSIPGIDKYVRPEFEQFANVPSGA